MDMSNCPECRFPVAEHIGRKACTAPAPRQSAPKSLRDLPVFGWAWHEDAKDTERP